MPEPAPPEYLTTTEVMAKCRVGRSTVSRWRREGILPGVKVGGQLRFRTADVEKLFEPDTAPVEAGGAA